jgi:hypothetical protein
MLTSPEGRVNGSKSPPLPQGSSSSFDSPLFHASQSQCYRTRIAPKLLYSCWKYTTPEGHRSTRRRRKSLSGNGLSRLHGSPLRGIRERPRSSSMSSHPRSLQAISGTVAIHVEVGGRIITKRTDHNKFFALRRQSACFWPDCHPRFSFPRGATLRRWLTDLNFKQYNVRGVHISPFWGMTQKDR